MHDLKNNIGERIKNRRKELGLSQEELAKRVGYTSPSSRTTINKIELGINDISQSKLKQYAKALNTNVAYLLGLEELWDSFDQTKQPKKAQEEYNIFQNVENTFGKDAAELLRYFVQLNNQGKAKAVDTLLDLVTIEKYKRIDE
jgi:transcriptional regulator with XRE-family HTH domain